MRAIVQRVTQASVKIDNQVTGEINKGLLVYLGVAKADRQEDLNYIAEKVTGLRIFQDAAGKMNLSVADVGGSILVVSSFTIQGDCRKGRRPSFAPAAEPQPASDFYQKFVEAVRQKGIEVQTGVFGRHMEVAGTNDGPVNFLLDSAKAF